MLGYILDRLPYIGRLRKVIGGAGLYPAGHYYSPIPTHEEIVGYLESMQTDKWELPAIDLNRQSQFELLRAFHAFYDDLPFPEKRTRNVATTMIKVFSVTQMRFFCTVF